MAIMSRRLIFLTILLYEQFIHHQQKILLYKKAFEKAFPRMTLNTRPVGLVFIQHPRDPANVNALKNMCDPYIIAVVFLLTIKIEVYIHLKAVYVHFQIKPLWNQ